MCWKHLYCLLFKYLHLPLKATTISFAICCSCSLTFSQIFDGFLKELTRTATKSRPHKKPQPSREFRSRWKSTTKCRWTQWAYSTVRINLKWSLSAPQNSPSVPGELHVFTLKYLRSLFKCHLISPPVWTSILHTQQLCRPLPSLLHLVLPQSVHCHSVSIFYVFPAPYEIVRSHELGSASFIYTCVSRS